MAPRDPALDPRVVRTHDDVLRATLDVLLEEGPHAVTHQRVADAAGYSKATVYTHWRTRHDLLRDAFTRLAQAPHHTPTGDLRADLVAELTAFRTAMEEHRLHRALAALVDLTPTVPGLAEVRDVVVTEGEQVLRGLLEPVFEGAEREAAVRMLAGGVLYGALLHGRLPDDDAIAASVDAVLRSRREP
jgi:AcrR family transcriptional regulator